MHSRWSRRCLPLLSKTFQRTFSSKPVDFSLIIKDTKESLASINALLDTPARRNETSMLQKEADRIDLWEKDVDHAQSVMQKLSILKEGHTSHDTLLQKVQECHELYEMAEQESDSEILKECIDTATQLASNVKDLKIKMLFTSEYDPSSCFLEIQAGAGGTESCDWVDMLLRMYLRWTSTTKTNTFQTQIVSQTPGEEAGSRSVMIKVTGEFAYGYLNTEAGVHRLVRVSPFDSQKRRHTSFAQVRIYPVVTESSEDVIRAQDLRIDTFRSSGAGGQHVNTTDSAVRITHIPSGIVTQCQSDRSQHRNKAVAMDMLRSKLAQARVEKARLEQLEYAKDLGSNEWGSQIRSYVLHPYKMVKDHRTGVVINDPDLVLDGNDDALSRLIEASLLDHTST